MKHILILFFIVSIAACSSPEDIPSDVMSVNTIKPILWDLMCAGAYTQTLYSKDSAQLKQQTFNQYNQVFKIYGITKEQFYHSYRYYLEHADKNKILMDSMSSFTTRKREDLFKKIKFRH